MCVIAGRILDEAAYQHHVEEEKGGHVCPSALSRQPRGSMSVKNEPIPAVRQQRDIAVDACRNI
jgi:hypothetical protein